MFTQSMYFRVSNSYFSSFAPQQRLSKLIFALGLASVVIQNEARISQTSHEKSLRGILHAVQDDRDLWVNCYIISKINPC